MISRRFFIGGGLACGALAGSRLWAGAAATSGLGRPNLRLGVLSDIHVSQKSGGGSDCATFRHALEWFRNQGVDAVTVTGDLTNNGTVEELSAVLETWREIFPDDRAPDGRKVERIFLLGNHDFHGYLYGRFGEKAYPDPAERARHVLRADLPDRWRELCREDYSRFFRREVCGYVFLGQHWDDGKGYGSGIGSSRFGVPLAECLAKDGKRLDPVRPFFYLQHAHLKDTCYGPWAWGHDTGVATRALSAFPNAVAISGHSHYPLTDERSVWQESFTAVGAASLRCAGLPCDECAPHGYENSEAVGKTAAEEDAAKTTAPMKVRDTRQGMLWSVYDDRIVIRRRDFACDLDLGDDWALPLPAADRTSLAFAVRKKRARAPEFAAGAKLAVSRVLAKTRAGVEKATVEILIPPARAQKGSRPHAYAVTIGNQSGKGTEFRLLAEGFCHAPGHRRASAPSRLAVSLDRLPAGADSVSVRPLDCWGNAGRPLSARMPFA